MTTACRSHPPQAMLGFHGFESADLEHITEEGRELGGGPDLWYYDNALNHPERLRPCEMRTLRLPVGITSAEVALRMHVEDILRTVVLHGNEGGRLIVQE